jgi:hypothetical protein
MNNSCRTGSRLAAGVLVVLLLLATAVAPAPVRAVEPAALPLAAADDNSFTVRRFFSGLNRRERVVQLCVGVMCIALFILCKKFSEEPR